MMRCVSLVVLAAACWASPAAGPAEPGRADGLQLELAASQQEIATLKRRLQEVIEERDDAALARAALEAKIQELEAAAIAAPPSPAAAAPPPRRRVPDASKTYAITLGSWPQRGPADAKVTIVFVHDYTCPYCDRARATLEELFKKYGRDLRVVYRPIVIRPQQSTPSALAACAAGRQRGYGRLEPLLWDKGFKARNYDTDATAPDGSTLSCWLAPGGCPVVEGLATEAGLDVRRFRADLPACEAEVRASIAELSGFGVNSTPSFFINGRYLAGAMPIEHFAALIDEEQRRAEERIRRGTPRGRYYREWVIARGEQTLGP